MKQRKSSAVTAAVRLQPLSGTSAKWLCLHDAWFPPLTAVRTRFGAEWLGIGFGIDDEAMDGELQVNDRLEDAAFKALALELREDAFHGVKPGRGGRRKVERLTRMTRQPSALPLGAWGWNNCRRRHGSRFPPGKMRRNSPHVEVAEVVRFVAGVVEDTRDQEAGQDKEQVNAVGPVNWSRHTGARPGWSAPWYR